jgi:hypothetical protein
MAGGTLCGNCGRKMSCGCQARTASDGKRVCTNCKSAYEAKIQRDKINKDIKKYIK